MNSPGDQFLAGAALTLYENCTDLAASHLTYNGQHLLQSPAATDDVLDPVAFSAGRAQQLYFPFELIGFQGAIDGEDQLVHITGPFQALESPKAQCFSGGIRAIGWSHQQHVQGIVLTAHLAQQF